MSEKKNFIESANAHIEEIGSELTTLEAKLKKAGQNADEWSANQVNKLKQDWEKARTDVSSLVDRMETEGEDALTGAREEAERHWDALKAAVKTYRDHVEKNVTV